MSLVDLETIQKPHLAVIQVLTYMLDLTINVNDSAKVKAKSKSNVQITSYPLVHVHTCSNLQSYAHTTG